MALRKNDPIEEAKIAAQKKEEEEKKKAQASIKKEDVEVVEKPIVKTAEDESLEADINAKRLEYKKYADKQKKINIIITSGVVVVLVAAFICMMVFSSVDWVTYVAIGAMACVLVVTYLSSKIMKKKLMANAEIYINYMYDKTSKYIYDDKDIKDLTATPKGSLEDKWFLDAHFYTNIKNTKSRNFAHFKIGSVEYDVCDLAGNTTIKNKLSPKFLGRYYSMKANYKTDGKVSIFQLKGGALSIPLDDIEDLKLIEGNDDYVLYSNDPNCNKIFSQKLIKELEKFKVENPLIDIIFSVKDNLISLGIDYVDEFLNIPVDKDFSIRYTQVSKQDFKKVVNVINVLSETNKKQTEEKAQ
jgi:hypothetical protein